MFCRIADDILEGCIDDIVTEIDRINSGIVDQIYNAEFAVVE